MIDNEAVRDRRHLIERVVVTGMAVLCGAILALLFVDGPQATVLGVATSDAVVALGLMQIGAGLPFLAWQQWSLRREQRRATARVVQEIREAVHD